MVRTLIKRLYTRKTSISVLIWSLLAFPFFSQESRAQVFEPTAGIGLTSYFGDLSSYEFTDGFKILFGGAIHGGIKYYPNRAFDIRAGVMFTMLRGDDAISSQESIRRRNLSFRSPAFQFDARIEWNILGFVPGDESERLSPFIAAGIGIMRFNPQALYEGTWYALQPLGTEGQGLDQFPGKQPYKRSELIFPVGGGLKFNLASGLTLTLEAAWHLTRTDYLDDVGGTSVSYPVLLEEKGPLTAALANRTGEYLGTDPVIAPTGGARGNPDTNDSYFTGLISIGYAISRGGQPGAGRARLKCPKF